MRNQSLLPAAALLAFACMPSVPVTVSPSQPPDRSAVVADLDRTVHACDDFYRFANGTFLATNPVPAAFPRWGRFEMLRQRNREILRQILTEASASRATATDPDVRRLGTFYASCMDEPRVAANHLRPIAPYLARIDAIRSPADVEPVVALFHSSGSGFPLFVFGSNPDLHDVNQMIAEISQGGLGMPAKDYYFDTDAKSAGIRDVYVKHIAKILTLSGETPAAAARDAAAAMTIESALAKASMRRAEMRPSALDHPMSIADLQRLAPHFDWSDYFQALETPAFDRLNVAQPEFFRALDQQLESASVDDWKAYLRWNLINTGADLLPMDWQRKTFSSMETCWTGARRTIRDGGSASISR